MPPKGGGSFRGWRKGGAHGKVVELGGIHAREADGGFEIVGGRFGESRVGGVFSEEFVFLTGGFDFRLPGRVGQTFELHEVSHVVARVGESGAGFIAKGGIGLGVFVESDHELGEFLARFGKLGVVHLGLGDFEFKATGKMSLVVGKFADGLGPIFDGFGVVFFGDGGFGFFDEDAGVVTLEMVLSGTVMPGGKAERHEEPES